MIIIKYVIFKIHFIGETDNNKLKVIILGKTTNAKPTTDSTAPAQTVTPLCSPLIFR